MKLSLTLHGKIYSVESDDQFDGQEVSELAEHFKGLLVNAGYHHESVDQYFNTDYQWFTEKEHQPNEKYNEGYTKGWDDALHNRKVQEFQENLYRPERVEDEDDEYDIFK